MMVGGISLFFLIAFGLVAIALFGGAFNEWREDQGLWAFALFFVALMITVGIAHHIAAS